MTITAQQILEELRGHRRTLHELFGASPRKPLPLGHTTMLPDQWHEDESANVYGPGRTMEEANVYGPGRTMEEAQVYGPGRTMEEDAEHDDEAEDMALIRQVLQQLKARRSRTYSRKGVTRHRQVMEGAVPSDSWDRGTQYGVPGEDWSNNEALTQQVKDGLGYDASPEDRLRAKLLMHDNPQMRHALTQRKTLHAAREAAEATGGSILDRIAAQVQGRPVEQTARPAYSPPRQPSNNGYAMTPAGSVTVGGYLPVTR